MIFLSILIILVAIALPSYNKNLSSILITRISAIIFIYSAVLSFNALYIQSIGSGIGIYSGLFHVTIISQIFDIMLFMLGALILIAWPLINISKYNKVLFFITLLKSQDGSSPFLNSLYSYKNNNQNLQLSIDKSKSSLSLYSLSELQKINIIGFYVPKTKYCLIILFSLLGSSLLISFLDLLPMYIIIKLLFLNLLTSILDYGVNINILTEYDFINNILNINNNTSYLLKNSILIILFFLLIISTIVSLAQTRINLILYYSTIPYILFTFLYLIFNTEQPIDSIKFYINFMISIYNYFIIIFVFFIINYFIFEVVLSGFTGSHIKILLLNKLNNNDLAWFNKFLLFFIISYFFIIIQFATNGFIHLDTILDINVEGVKMKVNGDYITLLLTHFGATSAFAIGSKIGASFVSKYPLSIKSKVGTSIAAGAVSSTVFKLTTSTNSLLRGFIEEKKNSDNSVNLSIRDVKITIPSNTHNTEIVKNLSEFYNSNLSTYKKNLLLPKFFTNQSSLLNNLNVNTTTNGYSSVLTMILDKNLNANFYRDYIKIDNDVIYLNSPLEKNIMDISTPSIQNAITEILSLNLIVNLGIIYFLFVLVFIITIRFVIDHDLFLDKVQNLPFGKFFHFIFNKLLKTWKNSNILWIYFLLFLLICCSISSTYAIYGCLFILNNI